MVELATSLAALLFLCLLGVVAYILLRIGVESIVGKIGKLGRRLDGGHAGSLYDCKRLGPYRKS